MDDTTDEATRRHDLTLHVWSRHSQQRKHQLREGIADLVHPSLRYVLHAAAAAALVALLALREPMEDAAAKIEP